MKTGIRKRPHEKSIRLCVTLTPVLFNACQELIRKGGYSGPSDYVQAKIRKDARLDHEEAAEAA